MSSYAAHSCEEAFLSYLLPCRAASCDSVAADTRFILDLTMEGAEPVPGLDKLGGISDVFLRSDVSDLSAAAERFAQTGVARIWLEILPDACAEAERTMDTIRRASGAIECIPVTGDYTFARQWLLADETASVALKGVESAGLVGADSIHVLFSALQKAAPGRSLHIWGGVGTAEGAAAFLGSGASSVVFQSMHWLTDRVGLDEEAGKLIRRLRYDNTALVGRSTGMPWRFFDKGNSKAVRQLTGIADCLGEVELREAGIRLGRESVERMGDPTASRFSADELIPLGPEAAFAARFEREYGTDDFAFVRFADTVWDLVRRAPDVLAAFDSSPAAGELGTAYPVIQGGMTWITDNFPFARAVAQSGALPTLTLGMRDRERLDQDFGSIAQEMEDSPYALNVLLLDENPFRDEQLAWIETIRPPFVTIAAGEPAFVKRFAALGIRVIYLAPNVGLLRIAVRAGADFVVLEGNEAGGHVGENTTLTLAQAALALRRDEPELFGKTRIMLAGGMFDRRTAFRAAMLGADGVQMGTGYLATREIVDTGALRPQYQKLILESEPGGTVLSGESIGLRVRSLKTPKLRDICTLERNFAAKGVEESERRLALEKVSIGTLFVAARGIDRTDGSPLSDDACLVGGQYMSGAVAGNISELTTLAELHALVCAAPMEFPALPEASTRGGNPGGPHERIAITGMAAVNSLGTTREEIFEASINLESGVGRVPPDRWDHSMHFTPGARVPNVYTDIGAFMTIDISRRDINVSPQDFRTMAASTKLTLLLAGQALAESGILDSGVPRERIAVITSQNSAESASTFKEQLISVYAEELVDRIGAVLPMTGEQRRAAIEGMRASGLPTDDTTLTGRLNCTAAGHICNQHGLNGPSYSVGAACASSLVGLHCALMLLRQGLIDAAVVGGGEEILTPAHYQEFSALGSLAGLTGASRAPSAASRPFDRDRDGFVLGEGGAMLVIERESVARARNAKPHAYITGTGFSTNHLGIVESVTSSQQIALRASFEDVPYGPDAVDLVECHGTSTNQGDREEVRTLAAVYPAESGAVLASFKSQVGHTLGASGVTSLIRGVMAMQRGVLPPTLNYETPDPETGLEAAGFRVLNAPEAWPCPQGRPRRMQVNAFGFGGASIVVHLEGTDEDAQTVWDAEGWTPAAVGQGGGDSVSVYRATGGFGTVRAATASLGQGDVAAMLAPLARKDRLSVGAVAGLAGKGLFVAPEQSAPMAWVFSGQGGWYAGMGRELYETLPGVRETLDMLDGIADFDLPDLLFHAGEDRLRNTRWQQPALFALEYAIARHLQDAGVVPDGVAGHSLGEFTALCVAEVFSPEEAFAMVCERGRLMESAVGKVDDPGGMIATDTPVNLIENKLNRHRTLFITNYNSPGQTVVGGPIDDLDALMAEVKEQGFRAVRLKVSMAFHSGLMAGVRDEFRAVLEKAEFHAPRLPVASNVSGGLHSADPSAIRDTLVDHLESPVLWTSNMYALWEEVGARSFLEIGPGDTLCAFASDIFPKAECRSACRESMERRQLTDAMAWAAARGFGDHGAPVALNLDPAPAAKASGKAAASSGDNVLERVIRIIMDSTGYERDEIDGSMDIRQDLNIRSSRLPVIMDEAERAFGLEFKIEDFIGVQTIDDLAGRIAELMGTTAQAAPAPAQSAKAAAETDVLERVIQIIMDSTGYERDEIDGSMDIRQDLNIRSSRLPVIMDEAERAFGLEFKIEDFIGVVTVSELAERIASLQNGEPAPVGSTSKPSPGKSGKAGGNELPVLRYGFEETLAGEASGPVAYEVGGPPVAVAFFGASAHLDVVGDWVRNDVQAETISIDLAASASPEEAGRCQGLVLLLDGAEGLETAEALERVFTVMKALAENRKKTFCLAVGNVPAAGASFGELGEGVLGMLLSGAMEYASTVFRFVAVPEARGLSDALDRAVCMDERTVELIFREDGIKTREPVAVPFEAGSVSTVLKPGDVVLLTGGGRGVTASIALSLASLGVRLALLGRSPATAPDTARTLRDLEEFGCEARYISCDVTDAQAVQNAVGEAVDAFGRVDAVLHGAGVIRDGFLQLMAVEDFNFVVRVKLQGLKNAVEAAAGHGLRLAAAFSSVAAWHGNVGQSNYCAANRAMAGYLDSLGARGIAGKTLWLPPVEGVGMADDPEVRQLLDRKGMGVAYVPVGSLSELVRTEMAMGGAGWTLFSRPVADPRGGRLPMPTGRGALGRTSGNMPLIDDVSKIDLQVPEAVVERTVSHARDPWLPDHRPYPMLKYPLFSAVMAVETFMEAARTLYPDFTSAGVRDVRFLDMIPCAEGVERQLRIAVRGGDAESGTRSVKAILSSRDVSPKGRQLDRYSECFTGYVTMTADSGPWTLPRPLLAEFDSLPEVDVTPERIAEIYEKGTAQQNRYRVIRELNRADDRAVEGVMVYGDEKDFGPERAAYLYPPYLLEAIMQLALFHPLALGREAAETLPVGIGAMSFARPCEPGEAVTLRARMGRESGDDVIWDAMALDARGDVLMVVEGLTMRRLPK